jgi:hypothetical protein
MLLIWVEMRRKILMRGVWFDVGLGHTFLSFTVNVYDSIE